MKVDLHSNLTKKSGSGFTLPKFRSFRLFNPGFTLKSNSALQSQLAEFKTIKPKQVMQNTRKRLADAVDHINNFIKSSRVYKGIHFEVDEASNRTFAVIKDTKSGRVLKKIPSEATMQLAANLRNVSGLFTDKMG